jgi:hypothetical protein
MLSCDRVVTKSFECGSESELSRVITILTLKLMKLNRRTKELVGMIARNQLGRRAFLQGCVKNSITNGRQLVEVTTEDNVHATKAFILAFWEHLSESLIDAAECPKTKHGLLVDDKVVDTSKGGYQCRKLRSWQE